MAVPKVLKNFNLFVDNTTFIGLCTQVSLPELAIQTESYRAGGMDGNIALDMGMEDMELGFTLAEHRAEVLRQFGLRNQNAVSVRFRAALVDDTEVVPYIIEARGMYTAVPLGDVQTGQVNPMEATLMCRYLKITLNGEDLVEIDIDNMKRVIDGTDVLEDMRNAINGS